MVQHGNGKENQVYDTIYRDVRHRIDELARGLSEADLDRTVPACPDWTVRELIAHLVGVAADVVSDNMAGAPGDDWTAAHIALRRDRPVTDDLAEWAAVGPEIEAAQNGPTAPRHVVYDAVQHEGDLRGAVNHGRPPEGAWLPMLTHVVQNWARRTWPAGRLLVHAAGQEWWIGEGEPVTTLKVDGYELWRGFFGRRSRAQLAAWQWAGDPAPYLDALPVFPPRGTDLTD